MCIRDRLCGICNFEIILPPGLAPTPALGGRDAGMAGLAQCHEILGIMSSAIRERENVMNFRRRSNPGLTPAHFAQGMRRDIPAPDGWPHAVVPLFRFWRPLISVVPGGDQPFVIRAVRFVGEIRTAGIPAGFLWFPWHCRLHSKRAAGVSARDPHPDFSMIHYMPDPMRSASGIDAVSV